MKRGGVALSAPADSASPAVAAHRATGAAGGKLPRSRQAPRVGTLQPPAAGAGVSLSDAIGPQTIVRINGSRAKFRVLDVTDGTAKLVDSAHRIRWRPVAELRRVQ